MPKAPAIAALALCLGAAACSGERAPTADVPTARVQTSGKEEVPVAEVPAEVIAAARAEQAGFAPSEAERETREGRLYYDIGGRLPDGSNVEFDIMQQGGEWKVVETQRDIAFEAAPAPVREVATAHVPAIVPTRVIESVQADGLTIFEIYSAEGGNPQGRKLELRWDGRRADVLTQEWAH